MQIGKLALVVALVASAGAQESQASRPSPWMPFVMGHRWKYLEVTSKQEWWLECWHLTGGEEPWWVVVSQSVTGVQPELWAERKGGLVRATAPYTGAMHALPDLGTTMLPLPLGITLKWKEDRKHEPGRDDGTLTDPGEPFATTSEGELESMDEVVRVPAGEFHAARVRFVRSIDRHSAATSTWWFAKGVGPVKFTWGSQTYELFDQQEQIAPEERAAARRVAQHVTESVVKSWMGPRCPAPDGPELWQKLGRVLPLHSKELDLFVGKLFFQAEFNRNHSIVIDDGTTARRAALGEATFWNECRPGTMRAEAFASAIAQVFGWQWPRAYKVEVTGVADKRTRGEPVIEVQITISMWGGATQCCRLVATFDNERLTKVQLIPQK